MGLPIEDDVEISLGWGWGYLEEYIDKVEASLKEATKRFEASAKRIDEDSAFDYQLYYDELPYILRNSFFVSAYSLLEYDLRMICKNIKDKNKLPISLNDLRGNILDQVKLFLQQMQIDLACENITWEEIINYCLIRNCIVHNNGFIKEDNRDLKEYVKKKGLMKEREIVFDDVVEKEIGLTDNFCREAVKTMDKFIIDTYKTSIRKNK